MRRAVLVILDGLRRDAINAEHTPNLVGFATEATSFSQFRSVFPSTTRVASASVSTGCHPSHHGLLGNVMALVEDGELVLHDAGEPDFLQHKRRVTGSSLARPTLSERVKDIGGAMVFANASPGAAYAHDPDGHGYVYHRAGSFGPGRQALPSGEALDVTDSIDGDRAMTERFVAEVLGLRRPALATLWLGHPDATQHEEPLGSPECLTALRHADTHVGMVLDAIAQLETAGDDVLLLIASDHGHQTMTGSIDIEAELIEAGYKDGPGSGDVLSAANGTAVLIYVHPDHADRTSAIARFLGSRPWVADVWPADSGGASEQTGLALLVSLKGDEENNEFGVAGRSLVAVPAWGKPDRVGCGQHGGIGRFEQSPFLMIRGRGFAGGATDSTPASLVDLAPTILAHFDFAVDDMDGKPRQCVATA